MKHRTMTLVFCSLQAGDLVTTWIALYMGLVELNPLLRPIAHSAGPMLLTKLAICVAYTVMLSRTKRIWPYATAIAWYVMVVGWNLANIVAMPYHVLASTLK